jgi:hypothetical protein
MDEESRRGLALGPRDGEFDGIDLARLDPDDEDSRRLLIEAEHPDLSRAMDNGQREIRAGTSTFSPVLHIEMHLIVANQLMGDQPPEMWDTAQRLLADGYERHDVLHMLASVVTEEIYVALKGDAPDPQETRARLAALPRTWEQSRTETSTERHDNRAGRRAAHRRPRRRR